MQNTLKKLVIGSMCVSGLVAALALADMFSTYPFGRQIVMDVMFILAGGLIIYMGYDALKDMQ